MDCSFKEAVYAVIVLLMMKLNLESVGQRILSVKVARTVRASGQRVVAWRKERNYIKSNQ